MILKAGEMGESIASSDTVTDSLVEDSAAVIGLKGSLLQNLQTYKP